MILLADTLAWLRDHTRRRAAEVIARNDATGRVLAVGIALLQRPEHPTAAMDGIAVRAAETEGASDYSPLPVAGAQVRAGGALPSGTDAVLPPHAYENGCATTAIARGGNVHPAGHDVPEATHLPAGTCLTPLHLVLLEADPVVRPRPRVAAPPCPAIQALLAQHGALVSEDDADLILVQTPGFTSMFADRLAIRPGETTAIGRVGTTPAICLPPHPGEAATVFALLVAPLLRDLAGLAEPPRPEGRLSRKITSSLGQLDAIRVRLDGDSAVPLGPAEGIGLLAAAGADGLVLVPEGSEGYPAGTMLPIFPL